MRPVLSYVDAHAGPLQQSRSCCARLRPGSRPSCRRRPPFGRNLAAATGCEEAKWRSGELRPPKTRSPVLRLGRGGATLPANSITDEPPPRAPFGDTEKWPAPRGSFRHPVIRAWRIPQTARGPQGWEQAWLNNNLAVAGVAQRAPGGSPSRGPGLGAPLSHTGAVRRRPRGRGSEVLNRWMARSESLLEGTQPTVRGQPKVGSSLATELCKQTRRDPRVAQCGAFECGRPAAAIGSPVRAGERWPAGTRVAGA